MISEDTGKIIESVDVDCSDSPAYRHGKKEFIRLHLNESPYGAPPRVIEQVIREIERNCSVYPAGESELLRRSIAEYLGCPAEMVAVGNGTDELIHLAAMAFHRRGARAAMTESTFPGYQLACDAVGMECELIRLDEHRVTPARVVAACKEGAGLIFLCNPHNPTGTVLRPNELDLILTAAEDHGAVVVIDEAYMDFVMDPAASAMEAVLHGQRAVVMRTFSKAWGVAALRVGYAVGPADLITALWQARQSMPFNVNRLAQAAVPALLAETDFLDSVRRRTAEARELLCRQLDALGTPYVPSETNFVMVETTPDSTEVTRRLAAEHHILVRDLAFFGRPGWIRVAVGTPEDVDSFVSALGTVLNGNPRSAPYASTDPHWRRPVPTLPAIEPDVLFNGFAGAHVAVTLHQLGVWEILDHAPAAVRTLAARTGASTDWMLILLRTMALLGYVELRDQVATLTTAGRALHEQMGLFVWGVGGYGAMLGNLRGLATGDLTYGKDVHRDEALIALGAGEADRALMQGIESEILSGIGFRVVADIGCGSADRLIRLCAAHPDRRGIGIDISAPACTLAAERVREAGLAERVEIIREDVLDTMNTRTFPGVDFVTCFFMLHDLFATDDNHADVIRSLRSIFPDARLFLFGDTAAQRWEQHTRTPPIFSLEFELVHAAMGVQLRAKETYLRAFRDAGLQVERCEPFGVPSTWAFLLSVPC